jgi:uncharacterized protein with gpF-like domain
MQEITEKINAKFDNYYENYEAERIARTEINVAVNRGRIEAMLDAGVEKKWWLTARDERVRDTHQTAGEQYSEENGISIVEDFIVGGHSCREPGSTGAAEEDINCRCKVEPVRD